MYLLHAQFYVCVHMLTCAKCLLLNCVRSACLVVSEDSETDAVQYFMTPTTQELST